MNANDILKGWANRFFKILDFDREPERPPVKQEDLTLPAHSDIYLDGPNRTVERRPDGK